MDKLEYFRQTEHALKNLFSTYEYYVELAKSTIHPVICIRHSGRAGEAEEMYAEWRNRPEVDAEFKKSEIAWDNYRTLLFSKNVISGSILQIASKSIEIYSKNTLSENNKLAYLDGIEKRKWEKYAIGRAIKDVPIGLIIYSGRNQYNHFNDCDLKNSVNVAVFKQLAYIDGETSDPAFSLDSENIKCLSSNILYLLGWRSYADYISDMAEMHDFSVGDLNCLKDG